jgi:hypothetical protein
MRHSRLRLCLAAFVLLILGTPVRAETIRWNYSWSVSPLIIPSTGMGTGGVIFILTRAGSKSGPANGTTRMIATEVGTFASPDVMCHDPERIVNARYRLKLTLTDTASRARGTLTFTGILNGTLTATDATLTNRFVAPTTESIHLGHHWYWVTLGPFSSPSGGTPGKIMVSVLAKDNPEPAGAVLMMVGMTGVGAWALIHRRARRSAAAKGKSISANPWC